MKIICPIKFTPDVDSFVYDYEKHELIRENSRQIIGPDDACALGFALRLKKKDPEVFIEAVTMAPLGVIPAMEDIARRGFDRVTLLSDLNFSGSDTLATGRVLSSYISSRDPDVILTGCRSLDGDTGHIPAELAGFLGLDCMSGITALDERSFENGRPVVTVETELDTQTYEIALPAVLGISSKSGIRLPFVRYADLDKDVSDRLFVLGLEELGISKEKTGSAGSATTVVRTYVEEYPQKTGRTVVQDDENGVETVWRFLKEEGYLP